MILCFDRLICFSFSFPFLMQIQTMTGRDLTTIERMQCGALSGLFAQTLTYPLEVTRRRMQTIGIVPTSGKDAAVDVVGKAHGRNPSAETVIRTLHPNRPPSMGAIVKELYLEQGVRGFFKGVSLNWFKGPIAFSIRYVSEDSSFLVSHRVSTLPNNNAYWLSVLTLTQLFLASPPLTCYKAKWKHRKREGCACLAGEPLLLCKL